jgi:hypothetical protein
VLGFTPTLGQSRVATYEFSSMLLIALKFEGKECPPFPPNSFTQFLDLLHPYLASPTTFLTSKMVHCLGMMEIARGMLQNAVATKLASWVNSA